MSEFEYSVNAHKGSGTLQKINRITVQLEDEIINRAVLTLNVKRGEKMFFNGYQTWTWNRELSGSDRVRGLNRVNRQLKKRFGFDRYGDYHFIDYPEKPGRFHGFSYCYFRDGENYRLFGSLSELEGYTVFRYDVSTQTMTITRDCEGVRRNGEFEAFSFIYLEGSEQEVFDGWFKAMNIKPIRREKLFGYSSWYNRYENISQESIREDLAGCKTILKKGDLFQIDDGWEPTVGDWLTADNIKFPQGMKVLADEIHGCGFKAGLWLAPFVATEKSEIWRDHQDWFLKHDGENWSNGSNWGGFYSLDLDHPEVRKHIEKVFDTVFNKWGFDLVKLDFLYAGAPWGDERESRAAKMIKAMTWLREMAGDKLILGCGVPLMPSFGLVDYCRIGCDVSLDWDDKAFMRIMHRERVSTYHSLDNTICRRQLNFRAFGNDPDVFFLRDDNIKLTAEEKEYLYTINALFSGILLTSDNPSTYSDEKKKLLSEIRTIFTEASDIKADDDKITYHLKGKRYYVARYRKKGLLR
ncbi:MAG: alpha-galactosidase [Erysipelotrichaceae bacterium]|nr:alpha-galactosidase [Erysipelotrichaceae bacterium]